MTNCRALLSLSMLAAGGCSHDSWPPATAGASDVRTDGAADDSSGDGGSIDRASVPWDWNGIIGTGQSLAVGETATPCIDTTQPFHNLKLSLGSAKINNPPYDPADPALSMAPLVEPIRTPPSSTVGYPVNIHGETIHTAMGNQITSLYKRDVPSGDLVTVHTVVGESGQGISFINKAATPTDFSGHAYAATLFEASAIKRLAAAAGKTFGIGAIVLTHGESDWGDTNYEQDIYQLYLDYNADIAAITGQTKKIPLLVTQQGTFPSENGIDIFPPSTFAQWHIGVDHPGQAICVGPKYQYVYSPDHLHLPAREYDRLGEKYAQVYYEIGILGHDWRPLEPTGVVREGNAIAVNFHVPVPPLMWDENLPAPHQGSVHPEWKNGRGFEVDGDGRALTIDSVAIHGDAVIITLDSPPSTANLHVRYAAKPDMDGTQGGLANGRIGQLSDSDPFVPYDAAKISCQVTQGSTTATCPSPLETRGPRDLVVGASLASNTAVVSVSPGSAVLSQPWTGASGTTELTFQTNQRNFAVSFDMPVPDPK